MSNFDAFVVFLKNGSMIRRLASLHWLQLGAVRLLPRYYQDAMTSCRPSRRTSFPSLGDTSVALVEFAPRRTSAPPRPGVDNPVSPSGMLPRKQQDLPSSWGTSVIRLHMFQTDAGRTACTRPLQRSSVALGHQKAKAPTFGSFDAIDGFRTRCLRFAGFVTSPRRKTRFQLLVRLYWTGFPPARVR
mgnify:CR=1 FL=1